MVTKHEFYSFLDEFSSYHQIMIAPEDRYKIAFITEWGAFIWLIMPFKLKNTPPTYQWTVSLVFQEYFSVFMKMFLDDFNVFNNFKTRLAKL